MAVRVRTGRAAVPAAEAGMLKEAEHRGAPLMVTEAELATPELTAQIARFFIFEPVDNVMETADFYLLNLCLTPRPPNTRACFAGHWSPHRFEPVGDLFLLPPGEALHVRSESGQQLSLLCQLPRSAVERWLDDQVVWTDRRLEACLNIASPQIRTLLQRLAEEVNQPGLAADELARLVAGQVAIELARFRLAVDEGPAVGGLASWRLRLIDERLSDLKATPTLSELAALCKLSVRQLTRGFRASRGCTITDYIARSRIEAAKRLLATDDSIKAIAFSLGFTSPSSFAFAFRRATGSTPRQFRQRVLKGDGRDVVTRLAAYV